MLTIRLSRIGKKKKPMYRLVISEKARDPYGKALEILGSYDPFEKILKCKKDRVEYWISKGAGLSATVNNLLIEKKIIKGEKMVASKTGKKKDQEEKPENKENETKPVEEKKEKNANEDKKKNK